MRALILIFALATALPAGTSLVHGALFGKTQITEKAFLTKAEASELNALLNEDIQAHISHDLKGAVLTNLATGERFKVLALKTNAERSATALIFETATSGSSGILPLQLIPDQYHIDISQSQLTRAVMDAKPYKNIRLAQNLS